MRPPAFWSRPAGWRARLLSPLAALYAAATARRVARPGYRARVPVVCVGNISVGGTGKTPTVIALAESLTGRGARPWIVSRGHGGSARGPLNVDPKRHDAATVGDEALLLAAFAPTVVSRDRAAGLRAAEAGGADIVLLDDGFQNPSVEKDFSIVVVDAETGFGNGHVLPAGPLREPVEIGLTRADFILTMGGEAAQASFDATWRERRGPVRLRGRLEPLETGIPWSDLEVVAFAGIGRPAKFFATLEDLGARLVRRVALDDHQRLSRALLTRLEREAAALGAQLVTTEKDAVRLPPRMRAKVRILPVRLVLEDSAPLEMRLAELLGQRPDA